MVHLASGRTTVAAGEQPDRGAGVAEDRTGVTRDHPTGGRLEGALENDGTPRAIIDVSDPERYTIVALNVPAEFSAAALGLAVGPFAVALMTLILYPIAFMVLLLTFVMCVGSGTLATRKLTQLDPADIF